MASRGRLGARSRRFELLALLLGVASGLVMFLAALEIRSRPAWAGQLALDEAARELASAVEAEWGAVLRSDELFAGAASGAVRVDDARLAEVRALIDGAEGVAPAPDEAEAFDALIAEARYQEVQRRDLDRAIGAIRSALALEVDPPRRARGRLRAVQLGGRSKDQELVREAWAAARAETEQVPGPVATRGLELGISCALLTGLAVAEGLEGDQRAAVGAELAGWWREGRVGVIGGAELRRGEHGILAPTDRADLRVLAGRIAELAGDRRLEAEVLERARLEAIVRWAEAEGGAFEPLFERDATGTRLLAGDEDLLVIRSRGSQTSCFFDSPERLRETLRTRLATFASFGRGFRVDFTGEEPELGEEVRPWTELAGGNFGFLLRHEDPAAFIRVEERRLGLLQLGLVGMGLFTLFAGVVSFGGLRRQRRLQELKTGFIARVSHELRTPVTGILLATEGLVDGRARTPERQERYFGLIQGEARRLERLIANVLDFSRLDRGEGARLDRQLGAIEPLAAELESEVAVRCAAAELEFESRIEIEGVEALLDAEALRRALMNLLDNAIRHAEASRIRLEIATEGGELVLALTDDGRGLPPALRERVFEPFQQGPASEVDGAGGAGLGLAIVREIASGHGGRSSCAAGEEGRGCRFELRLPLERQAPGRRKE